MYTVSCEFLETPDPLYVFVSYDKKAYIQVIVSNIVIC